MKLSEDQMKHILRSSVSVLSDVFTRNGFEIRVVGGAVRDLLMDIVPNDLDFSTTATTDEMKNMFEKEGIRMINRRGEKHGTVTAHIEEENLECSTLNTGDTDESPAEVACSDWKLDAGRRDLTVNALFLGLDGTVYDYVQGVKHIKSKRVTFVGDPDKRIQENHIRILRYFRFFGRIATDPSKHDPVILDSIRRNCKGLSKIPQESIWKEVKMILGGRFGIELLITMIECGVGSSIGLPEDFDCENMFKVYTRMKNAGLDNSDFHPFTLLASGFQSEDTYFIERMKWSNKEKDMFFFIIANRDSFSDIKALKMIRDLMVDIVYKDKKSVTLALSLMTELVKYVGRVDLLTEINSDLIPHFPIKGGMLVDKVKKRNRIGVETHRLLDIWKESNYSLGEEELLNEIKS